MTATAITAAADNESHPSTIKALDGGSIHRITSGQVVVDLQTAVKELVENSLDAGATIIEVRFKDYGLASFEVVDNGSGIAPKDYDAIALKHHTSKLSSFEDLTAISTFGFRGEALSSLCALAESVTISTATATEAPMGTVLEFDQSGRLRSHAGKVARQRGTTVTVTGLFKPLPVRRKELERTAKREFGKALSLLTAYALVPCANENRGVRLSVTNHPAGGKKTVQLRTDGTPSTRSSASAIWGPKVLENVVGLDLCFDVETEKSVLRRQGIKDTDGHRNEVRVKGLVSKFAVACGRTGTDRQFFYVNGRPCNPSKVQKAFNEVYRTFNANQTPFIVADFTLPTDSCDVNVSPDKRTILLHSENNLVNALRVALEQAFAPSRSTYIVNSQPQAPLKQPAPTQKCATASSSSNVDPLFLPDHADEHECSEIASQKAGELEARAITEEPEDMDENATLGTPLLAGTKAITGVEHVQMHKKYIPTSYAIKPLVRPVSSCSGSEPVSPSQGTRRSPHIHFPVTALLSKPSISQEKRESASLALGGDDIDMDDDGLDDAADRSLMSTQMIDAVNDSPQGSATQRCVIKESPHTNPCAADEAAGIELSTAADDVRSSRDSNSPASRAIPQVSTKKRVAFHSADTSRNVQMVLDTSGAAWNLRRHADESAETEGARKRPKLAAEGRGARVGLRELLRDFARSGSQVVNISEGGDEEDEEEVDEPTGGALEECSSADDTKMDGDEADEGDVEEMDVDHSECEGQRSSAQLPSQIMDLTADLTSDSRDVPVLDPEAELTAPTVTAASEPSTGDRPRAEFVRTKDGEDVSLRLDLSRVSASWRQLRERLSDALAERDSVIGHPRLHFDAGVSNVVDENKAIEALSRVIEKADFASMEPVGQFNLGFIIARRRKMPPGEGSLEDGSGVTEMDDLFIVDQHAADEKYNFEILQQTTKIKSQKLFQSQSLELTAADELIATENLEMLRQNGFEIDVLDDAPSGQRLQLLAQPTSKSTVFDMKDLEELLHLMRDRPTGQMVRCSKVRAMFAMRACRSSVMVGMPLAKRQMMSVVHHMGTMEQPWHCPHGRPTMRHLSDIVGLGWDRRQQEGRRSIDWARFGSR